MKKYFSFFFIIAFYVTNGCVSNDPKPGVSLELAEYRADVISDLNYKLFFNIPSDNAEPISATSTTIFTLSSVNKDLFMDFKAPKDFISSISINGVSDSLFFKNEHIKLPKELLVIGENKINLAFRAGESSLNRNDDYLYTLFVPDRARTAFPLFDQPNLKAVYELKLKLPSEWKAVSNSPIKSKSENSEKTVWTFEPSDKISSYLFSFVAGKFDQVTREVDGRTMTLLHRETDNEKVERNLDDIFELHSSSLNWLEKYTGIKYPFKKFDFVLIPSFQYGGMEHVGAIQYRASSLFLDKDPSETRLLGRANLIAHETAHMWFGNLVTMDWFNDVWTKEVFANFMAAKMVNPAFREVDHQLNFLIRHYPSAYSVDRTEGANPIRQDLPNLNEAGSLYGAIIYNKAPIMMRQLEKILGEEKFRQGIQEYLSTYKFKNATWPELISILDSKTELDLFSWSKVWVETAGRPHFEYHDYTATYGTTEMKYSSLIQTDPKKQDRIWAQALDVLVLQEDSVIYRHPLDIQRSRTFVRQNNLEALSVIHNSNGMGYGFFPYDDAAFELWEYLRDIEKGSLLINAFENILEGLDNPEAYMHELIEIVIIEDNQLIQNLVLRHINTIYWRLFSENIRSNYSEGLEKLFWTKMTNAKDPSIKKMFFNSYKNIALSDAAVSKLYSIWNKDTTVEGVTLSENDFIGLATTLSIKNEENSEKIVASQLNRIENPDTKRRFEFLIPSLSANELERDHFFESLKLEKNRRNESWVLAALDNLHHPLRLQSSEKYISQSLELLKEIQETGDIFFPKRWLDKTLENHYSDNAVKLVKGFLAQNLRNNEQLRMKILQAADPMFRTHEIRQKYF